MRRAITLAALVLAAAAAPAFGQARGGAAAGVRAAIEASNKRFVEAFNRGDAAAVARSYSADARALPPNAAMVEGRQAIQSLWQGAVASGMKLVSLETLSVETRGDLAFEVGRYTATVPGAGGQSVTEAGKFVVVWEKERGVWKMAADIWNSDAPAPGR
jgi:uncharacterized protein (TIGR02246 family)